MKYIKVVFLLILFCVLFKSSDAQLIGVKGSAHVLYIGMENSLNYLLKRYDTSIVDFKASSGDLSYYSQYNELVWNVCTHTDDSVVIWMYAKKTLEIVDSIVLKVEMLPDPTLVIPGDKHLLYWGKKELYENKVDAAFNAPGFKFKCKIISFGIQLLKDNSMMKEYENNGSQYTSDAVLLLKQFEKGDIAYFNEFRIKCGCEDTYRVLPEKLKFVKVGEIIRVERQRVQ